MSQERNTVKATLIFADRPKIDFAHLVEGLKRPVRNIALEFDEIELDQDDYALFDSDNMTLRVGLGHLPILKAGLICSKRPTNEDGQVNDITDLLADYRYSLEVTVTKGLLGESKESTQLTACYHVVRHLLREFDVTLVKWHPTGVLFTAEEFENPTELRAAVRPRRPISEPAPRTERPKLKSTEHFRGATADVATTHARLDDEMATATANMAAEMVEVDDTRASGRWDEVFPNLETTPEEPKEPHRTPSFLRKFLIVEEVKLDAPNEKVDTIEQFSVYVMTVTLMVLAFPIGFAMLIYNILGGENLRATARAMALTGFGMGLYIADLAPQMALFV